MVNDAPTKKTTNGTNQIESSSLNEQHLTSDDDDIGLIFNATSETERKNVHNDETNGVPLIFDDDEMFQFKRGWKVQKFPNKMPLETVD